MSVCTSLERWSRLMQIAWQCRFSWKLWSKKEHSDGRWDADFISTERKKNLQPISLRTRKPPRSRLLRLPLSPVTKWLIDSCTVCQTKPGAACLKASRKVPERSTSRWSWGRATRPSVAGPWLMMG